MREYTPADGRAACAAFARTDLVTAARWFGEASAALSLYCQGLNQSSSRHREERGAHQPAPRDRPDRPARRRAVLAHRPAERDGRARGRRHGDPAVRRIATSPNAAHRAEVAALWGVDRVPGKRRARRRSRCSTRSPPATIRMVWIACTNPAQSLPDLATRARGRSRAPSSSCCRRRTPTPRPRRSPTCCCPRRRGARRKARSPTPSGASRACARRCRAPGEARARLGDRRRLRATPRSAIAAFVPRAHADAVSRMRRPTRYFDEHAATTRRPRPRHHRALVRDARRARAAAVAVSRPARAAAGSGSTPTACSRRADGRARFADVAYVPVAEQRRRALSVSPQHRAAARPVARHEPHRHGRAALRARRRAGARS